MKTNREQVKYMSIVRLGHKSTTNVLNVGDKIVIQEKIDGANASFLKEGNIIRSFSRRTELNEKENLRGFYNLSQSLNIDESLEEVVYFGEWLVPHKVRYPKFENQFFLFDLYDLGANKYLPFSSVRQEAERLNLNLVPILYEGTYVSFEHLQQFIGKTLIGGQLGHKEQGEGIVVKNIDYLDRFGKQVFVKLVSDAFCEVQKQKPPKDPKQVTREELFVNNCLTKARVEKILYKLIDEGLLPEDFGVEEMSIILKTANKIVYDDMIKEESEMIEGDYEEKGIRRAIGKKLPSNILL